MTELPENEKELAAVKEEVPADNTEYRDEYEQFGTIFSEPQQKETKSKKSFAKRQLRGIIAAALALCILIGGTIAVVKLVPEKEDTDTTSSSLYNDISVVNYDISKINSVTVTNLTGTYKLLCEPATEENGNDGDIWYIEGIEKSFVDTAEVQVIVEAATSITAKRTITEKTKEDCGLDNPVYTAYVEGEGFEPYTVYVGKDSPDQTGTYIMLSGLEEIYLVYSTSLTSFDFVPTDLSVTTKIPATTFTTSITAYCDDDGALESFDTLTVSGKHFEKAMTFVPNKDDTLITYLPYVISSENNRYADIDVVKPIFKYFSEGLTSVGAYNYTINSENLAKYGLNDPDAVVTISVAGEQKQFKFAIVDDTYCAVVGDSTEFIRKVALSDVPMLEYDAEDFYSTFVYIKAITDISNVTLSVEGESYSFDVKNVPKDSDGEGDISCGDKKIKYSYFQNFYAELIGMTAADFQTAALSEQPSMTITYTDIETGAVDTVTFTKASATKYQFSVNGNPVGRIVSSEYNRIVKYAKRVADGKDIT